MAYTLEVNNPDFPDDTEFDCDGILVKNKSSKKLTEEDELAFIARNNGRTVKDIYGHGKVAKVTGSSELSSKQKAEAINEGGDK